MSMVRPLFLLTEYSADVCELLKVYHIHTSVPTCSPCRVAGDLSRVGLGLVDDIHLVCRPQEHL